MFDSRIAYTCNIKTVGDEDNYEVSGDVPVFQLGEAEVQIRNRHRGDESEKGFMCGGSRWINLYQCPGERQDSRLVCRQGRRPSEGYTVFHITECYGGGGGGYVSGYPEWGNPVHNQIQVCVRWEVAVAFIPDAGSEWNIVSEVCQAVRTVRTPGKDGWIKCADRSFGEVEVGSRETLCYQRAEAELETVLVSRVFPRLLGKGVCESLFGEGMSHSVLVADIAPRMTAREETPGRGEDTPDDGSYGGTRDSEFVQIMFTAREDSVVWTLLRWTWDRVIVMCIAAFMFMDRTVFCFELC